MSNPKSGFSCSFCQKHQDEVEHLISSAPRDSIFICNECVDLCTEIISEEKAIKELKRRQDLLTRNKDPEELLG